MLFKDLLLLWAQVLQKSNDCSPEHVLNVAACQFAFVASGAQKMQIWAKVILFPRQASVATSNMQLQAQAVVVLYVIKNSAVY